MSCWLAQFADTPCGGRIEAAHLISKQRIKNALGRDTPRLWDARVLVPACQIHHHALDSSRKLKIPRERIPPAAEEFAAETGLTWALDRDCV